MGHNKRSLVRYFIWAKLSKESIPFWIIILCRLFFTFFKVKLYEHINLIHILENIWYNLIIKHMKEATGHILIKKVYNIIILVWEVLNSTRLQTDQWSHQSTTEVLSIHFFTVTDNFIKKKFNLNFLTKTIKIFVIISHSPFFLVGWGGYNVAVKHLH